MAVTVGRSFEPKLIEPRLIAVEPGADVLGPIINAWKKKWRIEHYSRDPLGVPWPEDLFATRYQFIRGNKLYDWFGLNSNGNDSLVSDRLKRLIEEFEPGVHQFKPVEIVHQDGSPYPDQYWSFICCSLIDAVSPDLGGVRKDYCTSKPDTYPDLYLWTVAGSTVPNAHEKLAVYKDRIAGRAVWWDEHYRSSMFVSDAMLKRMEEQGMEGWDITYRWHEI